MVDKVLVADDSRTSRLFIIQSLEMAGLAGSAFLEAVNGHEALAQILQNPDLRCLVTDINMPERSGLALIRDLRAQKINPQMMIMVISSTQNAVRDGELAALGVAAVLQKPIQMPNLMAAVASLKQGA